MNQAERWLLKEKYGGVENKDFHADCVRLALGEPLGYLIGNVPFLDCVIYLDSHPLIPRIETEFWVEKAIKAIEKTLPKKDMLHHRDFSSDTPHILDLCAGSGAIGVAVAKAISEASITFAEIDPSHLYTIEKNIENNVQKNTAPYNHANYQLIESDLFSKLSASSVGNTHATTDHVNKDDTQSGCYDFILTNPPYIDIKANTVDIQVVKHEPHLALFGGHNGLALIERIIATAPNYIAPSGQLWLEHEPTQVEAITTLAHHHNFFITTHRDQYQTPRFSILTTTQ